MTASQSRWPVRRAGRWLGLSALVFIAACLASVALPFLLVGVFERTWGTLGVGVGFAGLAATAIWLAVQLRDGLPERTTVSPLYGGDPVDGGASFSLIAAGVVLTLFLGGVSLILWFGIGLLGGGYGSIALALALPIPGLLLIASGIVAGR